MTLIEFYNKYFLINLNEFSNIGIDLEINKILFCFLIGIIVATVVVNYRNAGNVRLIRSLIRQEAFDEESAKTLTELNINNFNSKLSLKGEGKIAKIVKRVGAKELSYEEYKDAVKSKDYEEEKIDFETARFYIKDDAKDQAKRISESNTTSVLNTVLFCVLLVTIYVFIMFLMPSILTFLNNILG